MNWSLYLNFLAAMVAILNPFGILPLWSQLTDDIAKNARSKIAWMIIITALITLLVFLLSGIYILSFFSIDREVFQIAGGVLLLVTGMSMVNGRASRLEKGKVPGDTDLQIARNRFREIVVPMAIPMLSGPGSITTVILFGGEMEGLYDYVALPLILIIVIGALHITFSMSGKIEKKVDPLVFNILTRLFGILVVAVSVQFILEGLGQVFPAWLEGASAIE